MTVLLLGATGNVGPHVARALTERGASTRALTRKIEHVLAASGQPHSLIDARDITPADVRRSLVERGMAGREAEHFAEMYQLFRDRESEFVSDDVARVQGRSPRTVEDYLHERRDSLVTAGETG